MMLVKKHCSKLALSLLATVLLVIPTACSSSGDKPDSILYKEVKVFKRSHFIMQIKPGVQETDKHVGYLKEKLLKRGVQETLAFSVCDRSWRELGFYFGDGETFRFKSKGSADYERLGLFEMQHSIERLLGIDGPFRLKSVSSR